GPDPRNFNQRVNLGRNDLLIRTFPNQGNGTSQPLHFQATLKQDGNIAIEPGEFKATSTFQVTYP
ncbi:hypothetical protein AB7153_17225, partial [Escherichia coli]